MFKNLTQKQKIAITVVILIIVMVVCYFAFFHKKGGATAKTIGENIKPEVKKPEGKKPDGKPVVKEQKTAQKSEVKTQVKSETKTQNEVPLNGNGQNKNAEQKIMGKSGEEGVVYKKESQN